MADPDPNELTPSKIDIYALLSLPPDTADPSSIKRAYRSTALKFHPDKNPDNPAAASQFHLLTQAYELLLDPERRAVYDQAREAELLNRKRHEALNAKRKVLVEDLKRGEQEARGERSKSGKEQVELERAKEGWRRDMEALAERRMAERHAELRRVAKTRGPVKPKVDVKRDRARWDRLVGEAQEARVERKRVYREKGLDNKMDMGPNGVPRFNSFPVSSL